VSLPCAAIPSGLPKLKATSRDFFQQVIEYDVPLTGAAEGLEQFNACIGNADFLWLEHDHPR
jgi:hypothetical protein